MIHAPLINSLDQFGRKTYPDEPFSPFAKRATAFFRRFLCFLLHRIDLATLCSGLLTNRASGNIQISIQLQIYRSGER